MDTKRNTYIDFVKGLSLICVFLGHSGVNLGIVTNLWQTFFMSAFFFFSGYYFRALPFKESVSKDIRSLLSVYYIWALGILVLVIAFETLALHIWPPSQEYMTLLKETSLGIDQHGFVSQLWFLVALFTVRLMWNLLCRLFKTNYWKLLSVGVILLLGIILNLMGWKGSPFRLVTAMIILPVFVCGVYAGKYRILDERPADSHSRFSPFLNWWQFGILVLIWLLGSWTNYSLFGRTVSFWGEVYNFHPLFFLNALSGILVFFNVATMIEKSKSLLLGAVESFFTLFGENSLPAFVSMNLCIEIAVRVLGIVGIRQNWLVCILAILLELPTIWLLKQKPFKWLIAR